ncbi:hypothetical protein P3S67_018570 [Capsicum chacoense]
MAGSSSYKLDPGPLEPSVLTQQLTHRSRDIWDGRANMILNMRKSNGSFWKLITGEATITLQDVEVLYGLPVNGAPVLGIETTRTIGDWQNICQRFLGFVPSLRDFSSSFLKVSALKVHMLSEPQLSEMATQEIVNQKARCYMFWMIAGTMMADISGSYLKLIYLPMLEDVNAIGSYSWGSATLAYLYRFLCKASQSIQNEIVGYLPLLQVWAWERITALRPQIVGKRDTGDIFPNDLHRGPHDTGWDALDSMTEDQFIWEPYNDDLIESLPDYCRAGRDMWCVRVLIFYWDVVEVHLPDRVMRQFGLQRVIPNPFLFDSTHFCHDRRGRPNTNWELEHAQWLPFGRSENNISVMHQSIMGHFGMMTPTLFGTDVLLVFSLVILISVLNANKVMCLIQLHMKQWRVMRGKDGVAGRRERDIARDQVHVEMNEIYEAAQNAQISLEDDQETTNHDFSSTSMVCTQEFTQASGMTYQHTQIMPYMTPQTQQTPQISRYPSLSLLDIIFSSYQPQHFENAPNFTSSPVPMSIDIPDATNNLENLNTEMEDNELDDANNKVNGNDSEDESKGCDTTIQHDELSKKEKRTIIAKLYGTVSVEDVLRR